MTLKTVTDSEAKALGCRGHIFCAARADGSLLLANCESCPKRNECEKSAAKEEG